MDKIDYPLFSQLKHLTLKLDCLGIDKYQKNPVEH